MSTNPRVHGSATLKTVAQVVLSVSVLLACYACGGGGGGGGQLTQPGPPSSFPPGCGMSLFTEPECEALLDKKSCAQQDQCAHDPGCSRIVQCWNACEAQRKEIAKRDGSGGCECFPNCFPQANETPGYVPFMRIIGLSQDSPPPGMTCRSGC